MVSNPEDSRSDGDQTNEVRKYMEINLSHRIRGAGIFTCIYLNYKPNVGKYILHGSYGYGFRFSLEHFVQ